MSFIQFILEGTKSSICQFASSAAVAATALHISPRTALLLTCRPWLGGIQSLRHIIPSPPPLSSASSQCCSSVFPSGSLRTRHSVLSRNLSCDCSQAALHSDCPTELNTATLNVSFQSIIEESKADTAHKIYCAKGECYPFVGGSRAIERSNISKP